VKINNRRGRNLTIVLVGGPHAGVLRSVDDESQANMIWLLTNYGRSGSEFIRMSPAIPEQSVAVEIDTLPPIEAYRYRVCELVESESEIRLICQYKSPV
jgi:hypothetical protein